MAWGHPRSRPLFLSSVSYSARMPVRSAHTLGMKRVGQVDDRSHVAPAGFVVRAGFPITWGRPCGLTPLLAVRAEKSLLAVYLPIQRGVGVMKVAHGEELLVFLVGMEIASPPGTPLDGAIEHVLGVPPVSLGF